MILTIDAGNSRTKWGVFDYANTLIATGIFANKEYPIAPPEVWRTCKNALVACVAGEAVANNISRLLALLGISAQFVQSSVQACGLENGYDHPAQLGVDRWAAAIAAWQLTQAPCVVVNAGTAVTVDAIAVKQNSIESHKQGVLLGGLIVPGLQLMQSSLLGGTAQIQPAVANNLATFQAFPSNTASAVHTGAVSAILGAIKAMLTQLQNSEKTPVFCVLSGGDAAIFAAVLEQYSPIKLAAPAIVDAHLVLKGLLFLHQPYEQLEH